MCSVYLWVVQHRIPDNQCGGAFVYGCAGVLSSLLSVWVPRFQIGWCLSEPEPEALLKTCRHQFAGSFDFTLPLLLFVKSRTLHLTAVSLPSLPYQSALLQYQPIQKLWDFQQTFVFHSYSLLCSPPCIFPFCN